MPPNEDSNEWLGDLRWQGYPRLKPVRDIASEVEAGPMPRRQSGLRVETLARENEALRTKIESLVQLASEFERKLSEAGSAYEAVVEEYRSLFGFPSEKKLVYLEDILARWSAKRVMEGLRREKASGATRKDICGRLEKGLQLGDRIAASATMRMVEEHVEAMP